MDGRGGGVGWALVALVLMAGSAWPAAPARAESDALASAWASLDAGDFAAALVEAERVLANDRRNAEAYQVLGLAQMGLGRTGEAERSLVEAARRKRELPSIDLQIGEAKSALADEFRLRQKSKIAGNLDREALRHFDFALAGSPGDARALAGRARTLVRLGRNTEAIESLEAWVAADPGQPRAWLTLAELRAGAGRAGEALDAIRHLPEGAASEAPASFVPVAYTTARLLHAEMRPDDAAPLTEALRAIEPDSWRVTGLDALDRLQHHRPFEAGELLLTLLETDVPREDRRLLVETYHAVFSSIDHGSRTEKGAESGGSGSVPAVTLQVAPSYPPRARDRGMAGTVFLLVIVDEAGLPSRIEPIAARVPRYESIYAPHFERAAVEAVRSWRFRPAMRDGRAVRFPLTVEVDFAAQ